MILIINIPVIIVMHLACLILYPDTGRFGTPFLFVSLLLWIALLIFLKPATTNFKSDTVVFLNILYIILMLISLLTLTPQKDSVSILNKIIQGKYPDKKSIYKGLLKIGIERPKLLKEIIEEENKKAR